MAIGKRGWAYTNVPVNAAFSVCNMVVLPASAACRRNLMVQLSGFQHAPRASNAHPESCHDAEGTGNEVDVA